jgi:hypothetical protein
VFVWDRLVEQIVAEEMDKKQGGKFAEAAQLFAQLMTGTEFPEFLTLIAYDHLE